MHRPPPISMTVGRPAWHKHVLLALWFLGVVATCAFVLQQTSGWQRFVVPATCLIAGWFAWRGWNQAVTGRLQWDGDRWYWTHFDGAPVSSLSILLDLQRFVLVRLVSEKGDSAWLWLQSAHMDASWLALRRALVHGSKAQLLDVQSLQGR